MSTVGRHHLNDRAFVNDADVVILRNHDTSLTPTEKHTLLVLNVTFGGLLLLSDELQRYDQSARETLRSLFPMPARNAKKVVHEHPRVDVHLDSAGRSYRVLANLGVRRESFDLGNDLCFEKTRGLFRGRVELAQHESAIVHVLEPLTGVALAATGHLFPCSDVDVRADASGVHVTLRAGARAAGLLVVAPIGTREIVVNGKRHAAIDDAALGIAHATIAVMAVALAPQESTGHYT